MVEVYERKTKYKGMKALWNRIVNVDLFVPIAGLILFSLAMTINKVEIINMILLKPLIFVFVAWLMVVILWGERKNDIKDD